MGHGLGIGSSGTHVAFCGGTGIFVFVDLVAHLIRKYFGQLSTEESKMLNTDFKFVLYASFPNRTEAYAAELCEKFDELCIRNNWPYFELRLRISNVSKERWDKEFIEKQFTTLDNV